jgi:hypothetical protein
MTLHLVAATRITSYYLRLRKVDFWLHLLFVLQRLSSQICTQGVCWATIDRDRSFVDKDFVEQIGSVEIAVL